MPTNLSKPSRRGERPHTTLQTRSNQRTIAVTTTHQQVRIAPLPTPAELAEFDQVLPGLAERIVTMAEQNGRDRRLNNRTMRWSTILGQVFAFLIMMSALAGGFTLVREGRDVVGMAAIITAIGVPLGVFVYNRTRPQPTS